MMTDYFMSWDWEGKEKILKIFHLLALYILFCEVISGLKFLNDNFSPEDLN